MSTPCRSIRPCLNVTACSCGSTPPLWRASFGVALCSSEELALKKCDSYVFVSRCDLSSNVRTSVGSSNLSVCPSFVASPLCSSSLWITVHNWALGAGFGFGSASPTVIWQSSPVETVEISLSGRCRVHSWGFQVGQATQGTGGTSSFVHC